MQFLSATISPDVDLVSAPNTTPPSNTAPQIVVPVLVLLGVANPLLAKNAFLQILNHGKKASIIIGVSATYDFHYLIHSAYAYSMSTYLLTLSN